MLQKAITWYTKKYGGLIKEQAIGDSIQDLSPQYSFNY